MNSNGRFDLLVARFYVLEVLMNLRRSAYNHFGRWLFAVVVMGLYAAGSLGFHVLHHHVDDQLSGDADHCNICLAHATGSIAITSDVPVVVTALERVSETVIFVDNRVVSHAPLTADSRGPPSIG